MTPAAAIRAGHKASSVSRLRGMVASLCEEAAGMAKKADRIRLAHGLYRMALRWQPDRVRPARELAKSRPRAPGEPRHINALILGTRGQCNASCLHCPTGKPSTANSPRGTMPMALFRKIVDGVSAEGLAVNHIGFGLFGDGLLDPLVVERATYVRQRLPDVALAVNTNGAAYNPGKHAALAELVSTLTLHCESIDPDTFDALMTPLRATNVFPKYAAILRDFPNKVRISVPVSRRNIGGLHELRAWFMDQGAREVSYDAMSSRCMTDRSAFSALALNPYRIRCSPDVIDDLIVDCDGTVVPCCNDFVREQPIGDLARDSFRDIMLNRQRMSFADQMRDGAHDEIPICSRCFGDLKPPGFPFDAANQAAVALAGS